MRPNILITGTPGTGKTTLAQTLAVVSGVYQIKSKKFYSKRDEEFDSLVLDEESEDRVLSPRRKQLSHSSQLLDEMESLLATGGKIVDFHSNSLFPERWFQLVIVLRTDNTVLYDRLVARGYNERKIEEDIECEIMQVVLEEAQESYAKEVLVELKSDTIADMESNAARVQEWVRNYERSHGSN